MRRATCLPLASATSAPAHLHEIGQNCEYTFRRKKESCLTSGSRTTSMRSCPLRLMVPTPRDNSDRFNVLLDISKQSLFQRSSGHYKFVPVSRQLSFSSSEYMYTIVLAIPISRLQFHSIHKHNQLPFNGSSSFYSVFN